MEITIKCRGSVDMSNRPKLKRRAKASLLDQIAYQPIPRNCAGCGSYILTINQGAARSPVMRNGRFLCCECLDRDLPPLTLHLRFTCESADCRLPAEDLHPCDCGVHLFCMRHHWMAHLEESGELLGDYESRWAACIEGIDLCSVCTNSAKVACECSNGHRHLFCPEHHREMCGNVSSEIKTSSADSLAVAEAATVGNR